MLLLLFFLQSPISQAANPEGGSFKISAPKISCLEFDLFASLQTREVSCFRTALKNMNVNETNTIGDTPLHAAIRLKNKYAIPFLIKNGADLSARNNNNQTPRDLALELGFLRLENYLANAELESDRLTKAIDTGDLAGVEAALKRGASIGTKDTRRDTHLHRAAQSDFSEIAQLLIKNGAAVDTRNYLGETPLHSACLRDFAETIKILIEAGANPSALNFRRESPIDLAMVRQNSVILATLSKHKAKRGNRADVSVSISGGEGEDLEASAGLSR